MSYCELVHQRHRFVTNPVSPVSLLYPSQSITNDITIKQNIDSREVRWMSNKIRAIEGLQLKVRHNLQYSPSMVFTIACLAAIEVCFFLFVIHRGDLYFRPWFCTESGTNAGSGKECWCSTCPLKCIEGCGRIERRSQRLSIWYQRYHPLVRIYNVFKMSLLLTILEGRKHMESILCPR